MWKQMLNIFNNLQRLRLMRMRTQDEQKPTKVNRNIRHNNKQEGHEAWVPVAEEMLNKF